MSFDPDELVVERLAEALFSAHSHYNPSISRFLLATESAGEFKRIRNDIVRRALWMAILPSDSLGKGLKATDKVKVYWLEKPPKPEPRSLGE